MKSIKYLLRRSKAAVLSPRLEVQKTVVTAGEVDPCPNPIFIVSCHRSGSSLLRRILNSHPNIACPPETFFLSHFMSFIKSPRSREGLSSIVGEDSVEDSIRQVSFQFHEAFRVSQDADRWADKSPTYLVEIDALQHLAPDDAQFIILLRDPLDVAASMINRDWYPERNSDDIFENTRIYLEKRLPILIDAMENEVGYVLRYEEYTRNPREELGRMFDFLGEPWDDAVLSPWEQQHNYGIEDPTVRGLRSFSPNVGQWKDIADPRMKTLVDAVAADRAAMGYSG